MHVILRGIDRGAIFFADDNYRYFLVKLSEISAVKSVGKVFCRGRVNGDVMPGMHRGEPCPL